jgi:hypothetical protein
MNGQRRKAGRSIDAGRLDETDAKVFRTAAVALRYADMSAAFDGFAAARMAGALLIGDDALHTKRTGVPEHGLTIALQVLAEASC